MCSEKVYFNDYIFFEPDSITRVALKNQLILTLPQGVTYKVYSDVLSEKKEVVFYQEGLGYCSQVWAVGSQERHAKKLDDYDLFPDLIKVHTEGSELSILTGAKETISRTKPALVYSVYHRRNGFFSDIFDAMEMFPNYSWYFRLHGYQGTGAFIYAIPQN